MALGQMRGHTLDQSPAAIGIARNEHSADKHKQQRHQCRHSPCKDFQWAADQKACPSPI